MQASLGLDDRLPLVGLELLLESQGLLHLVELEEDELVVGVSVSVELDEELEGFFLSTCNKEIVDKVSSVLEEVELRGGRTELTVGEEESRSLGNELDSDEDLGTRKRRVSRFSGKNRNGVSTTHVKSQRDLDDVRDSPAPARGEITRSEDDPGRDDTSKDPVGVL